MLKPKDVWEFFSKRLFIFYRILFIYVCKQIILRMEKIGKITQKDYIKANRIANRECMGWVAHKVHKSKKQYSRKNYRINTEE